ncbi:hypothetical protein C4K14_3880 [Pseudomonas chlororaphis subsp. aureofaciens]|nr:hypothetical protein C4K14_3880 [Pseudomonas chlororaphis subsp. aureofaciens]
MAVEWPGWRQGFSIATNAPGAAAKQSFIRSFSCEVSIPSCPGQSPAAPVIAGSTDLTSAPATCLSPETRTACRGLGPG